MAKGHKLASASIIGCSTRGQDQIWMIGMEIFCRLCTGKTDANWKSPIQFQPGFQNHPADILLETAALVMNRYLRAVLTRNQAGPVQNQHGSTIIMWNHFCPISQLDWLSTSKLDQGICCWKEKAISKS